MFPFPASPCITSFSAASFKTRKPMQMMLEDIIHLQFRSNKLILPFSDGSF